MLEPDLSRVRLLIFDLDGTLLDSVPQLHQAVDSALRDLGLPGVSQAQVQTWIGNGADVLIQRAMLRQYVVSPAPDEALFRQVRARFEHHYQAGLASGFSLYPGVRSTLAQLKPAGYLLAVVTNKPSRFVPGLLAEAGLDQLFDLLVGGSCLPVRKPDPAPLLHVCRQLGVPPAASLMVGDSKNDIQAARAAGIPVVGLTYGYNHGEPIAASAPDWIMDDFRDLAGLLAGHAQGICNDNV